MRTVVGVDEDLRHPFATALAGHVEDERQRAVGEIVLVHGRGDGHQLLGGVAQEELVARLVPERQGALPGHAVLGERRQCRFLAGGHRVRALPSRLGAVAQRLGRLREELVQQRRPPTVPQGGIGGHDVGDGERVQVVEPRLCVHRLGELMDDFRIEDVLALRRGGHHEMYPHQPRHQFGVILGQAVALAERRHILGAECRVVAATPFAQVVEQPGDVEQLDLRQVAHALPSQRPPLAALGVAEAPHVANDHHGVRVHGVDVEEVVLHLANDTPELGDVAAQDAVAPHPRELAHQSVGRAQQIDEIGRDLRVLAERVVDEFQTVANEADGGGAHAGDVLAVRHDDEQLHERRRLFLEHVRRGGFHVVVMDLEAGVHRLDLGPPAGAARQHFVEMLQQDVVDFAQRQHMAVVVMHELLDG